MKILGRLKAAYRALTLEQFTQLGIIQTQTAAGVPVDESRALTLSAYWNGVDIISGQVASLPRIVYRRTAKNQGETRERATTHPAYRVLHDQPNEYMTPMVFWSTLLAHTLTWGNGYAEIERDNANRPVALWPLCPDRMQPNVESYAVGQGASTRVFYVYQGKIRFEADDVLHIPGLGYDGLKGYSVVGMARQSLGLGLAAEQFGAAFFGNGALPGIVLEHPDKLSKEAQERLVASWNSEHQGPSRAQRLRVLEEGMKANKLGIPPDDAQFLETREFQVVEIARWLNLPPHKLKHKVGERPGGNIEASQIEFLTDTLRPWLIRVEQECNRKLISASQRSTFYVEHLADAILRMDSTSRAASYKAYFDMGVIDAEFIAEKENFPPPPPPKPVAAPAAPPAPASAPKMAAAQRALVLEVMQRFVKIEGERAVRAAKKGPAELEAYLEAGEEMLLRGYLIAPVRIAMAQAGADGDATEVAGRLARAYAMRSRDELGALPVRNLAEAAAQLTAEWEATRPLDMADAVCALTFTEEANV